MCVYQAVRAVPFKYITHGGEGTFKLDHPPLEEVISIMSPLKEEFHKNIFLPSSEVIFSTTVEVVYQTAREVIFQHRSEWFLTYSALYL